MITQEQVKDLLTYDPQSGSFYWNKSSGRRCWAGKRAGSLQYNKHTNYVYIGINKEVIAAHRLAFLYMTGVIPECVDHINGVGTDNRWDNLRPSTRRDNAKNRKKQRISTGITKSYKDRGEITFVPYTGINKLKEFKELTDKKYF